MNDYKPPTYSPDAIFALQNFANDVLDVWRDGGALDGGAIQDMAIVHGLLQSVDPAPLRPCADDCACSEYYGVGADGFFNDPVLCYAPNYDFLGYSVKDEKHQNNV